MNLLNDLLMLMLTLKANEEEENWSERYEFIDDEFWTRYASEEMNEV